MNRQWLVTGILALCVSFSAVAARGQVITEFPVEGVQERIRLAIESRI